MKLMSYLLTVASLFATGTAFALKLSSFQGTNYYTGGGYCGLHLEVSGDDLIVSTIIPPYVPQGSLVCGTGYWGVCTGSASVLTCDTLGNCSTPSGGFQVKLLEDGNLVDLAVSKKYLRSLRTTFEVCGP